MVVDFVVYRFVNLANLVLCTLALGVAEDKR